ncbi:MAG: LLM class flavin-dependent oxidoreductase [Actinomycetota bacterium]
MKRLGLTIGLEGASVTDALELCREAEGLGYTDAWSAEVGGADGFAPLAALAGSTSRMRLGTAIVPVFTRPPALLAMSASTVQQLSGGRFVLGLGTSSDVIVSAWMGGSFERPLDRLREYVEVLRDLFAGKKVSHAGETVSVNGFRLQIDPGSPPPIYLAALGPKACRLAGEVADGVIFFMKSVAGAEQGLGWVAEGARAAGRDVAELDCVIRLPVAVEEDEEMMRFMARRLVTTYAAVDVYNRSLSAQGFEAEANAVKEAWRTGDRDQANAAVTDDMMEQLLVMGDAASCRARLEEFRNAGVKTPVLLPVSVAGDPVERAERIRAAVRALAP